MAMLPSGPEVGDFEWFEWDDRYPFEFEITSEFVGWWKEGFYDPHGLTPQDLTDILTNGLSYDDVLKFSNWDSRKGSSFLTIVMGASKDQQSIYLSGHTIHMPNKRDMSVKNIEMDMFDVDENFQGRGISGKAMSNIYDFVKLAGIERMTVEAYLEAGPYAWLSYGFVPFPQYFESIKEKLADKLDEFKVQLTDKEFRTFSRIVTAD